MISVFSCFFFYMLFLSQAILHVKSSPPRWVTQHRGGTQQSNPNLYLISFSCSLIQHFGDTPLFILFCRGLFGHAGQPNNIPLNPYRLFATLRNASQFGGQDSRILSGGCNYLLVGCYFLLIFSTASISWSFF